MIVLELLGNLLTTALIGYLALTNTLADSILTYIEPEQQYLVHTTEIEEVVIAEESLEKVPSQYTYGGPIPRILLENSDYQAAVADGLDVFLESVGAEGTLVSQTESALVNIYCQYRTDEYVRTTTGTGFFIHQSGVVLTNAHVAQFLLLEDAEGVIAESKCILRGGDPAVPLYEAKLLYISPLWINTHASLIDDRMPKGTGERDYALLYVSDALTGNELPEVFPTLSIDTALLQRRTEGSEVLVAGYPADALYTGDAETDLTTMIDSTTVGELYTFGSNYADIFSISDSEVGEHGSSGGPIIRPDGTVIGLIVTKGDPELEGARSLRALTLSYINRTITEETGFSLIQNMQGDLPYRGQVFKEALGGFLTSLLIDQIQ